MHTCYQSDLALFARTEQSCVEFADDRITSSGNPSSHVQSCAHASSAAPDGTTAFESAAVAVERRNADQSRDLFTVEFPQFRQLSEKHATGNLADTGDATEQIFVLFPDRTVMDASVQIFVNLFQLGFQPADVSVDAFGDGLRSHSQPTSLGHNHLGDLSSPSDQRAQFHSDSVRQRAQRRAYRFTTTGKHLSIDSVGLSQLPGGLGEVPDLARVDHHRRQLGTHQCMHDLAFKAAAGFQHDPCGPDFTQPFDQGLDSGFVVENRFSLARGTYSDIELRFGDIDADKDRGNFQSSILLDFNLLQLSSTLRKMRALLAQATVRAFREAGRDDPCSRTISHDRGNVGLSHPVSY